MRLCVLWTVGREHGCERPVGCRTAYSGVAGREEDRYASRAELCVSLAQFAGAMVSTIRRRRWDTYSVRLKGMLLSE